MSPTLSIIVINFNTFALTCQCIDSIISQTPNLSYEIILIDNASIECPPNDFLAKFPNIRLFALPENVGFGKANNYGMDRAEGQFFCALNSDTIVLDHALEKCVAQLIIEPDNIAALGAHILNPDGSTQNSFWNDSSSETHRVAFRRGFNYSFLVQKLAKTVPIAGNTKKDDGNNRIIVAGLYGAFILIRATVYKELKGFDPDFFMYCEETEWFRLRIAPKYQTVFFAPPQIIHIGSESSKKSMAVGWSERQNLASYMLYWYKFGRLKYLLFCLGLFWACLLNWPLYFFLSTINKARTRMYSYILARYFFSILRYSPTWGSRPKPFKIN
jgi:hypothetical protein